MQLLFFLQLYIIALYIEAIFMQVLWFVSELTRIVHTFKKLSWYRELQKVPTYIILILCLWFVQKYLKYALFAPQKNGSYTCWMCFCWIGDFWSSQYNKSPEGLLLPQNPPLTPKLWNHWSSGREKNPIFHALPQSTTDSRHNSCCQSYCTVGNLSKKVYTTSHDPWGFRRPSGKL